jgi:hypothetical protein
MSTAVFCPFTTQRPNFLLLEQWSNAKCPKLREKNIDIDTDEVSHQVLNQVTNLIEDRVNNLVSHQVSNLIKDEVSHQLATNINQVINQDANQFLTDANFIKEVANLVRNQLATKINQDTNQVTNQVANQLNLFSDQSESAITDSTPMVIALPEEKTPETTDIPELEKNNSSDNDTQEPETHDLSISEQLPPENDLKEEVNDEGTITPKKENDSLKNDSERDNFEQLPQDIVDKIIQIPLGEKFSTKEFCDRLEISKYELSRDFEEKYSRLFKKVVIIGRGNPVEYTRI